MEKLTKVIVRFWYRLRLWFALWRLNRQIRRMAQVIAKSLSPALEHSLETIEQFSTELALLKLEDLEDEQSQAPD